MTTNRKDERNRFDIRAEPYTFDILVFKIASVVRICGDDISAERLDSGCYLLVRTVSNADEDDDRGNADD